MKTLVNRGRLLPFERHLDRGTFSQGQTEETCRSRISPTGRIARETFVLLLDHATTVTTVDSDVSDRGSLKAVAFARESPSPRRSLLHSSRRIGDSRPRRLQTARFPGRIGRRPRPDSPSQNWSGVRGNAPVKGARVCGRSRIFFPRPWSRDLPIEDLSHRANRSRNFRSGLGPCHHRDDGRFRRFRPRQASRIAQIR